MTGVLALAAAGATLAATAAALAALLRLEGLTSFVLGAYLIAFADDHCGLARALARGTPYRTVARCCVSP